MCVCAPNSRFNCTHFKCAEHTSADVHDAVFAHVRARNEAVNRACAKANLRDLLITSRFQSTSRRWLHVPFGRRRAHRLKVFARSRSCIKICAYAVRKTAAAAATAASQCTHTRHTAAAWHRSFANVHCERDARCILHLPLRLRCVCVRARLFEPNPSRLLCTHAHTAHGHICTNGCR